MCLRDTQKATKKTIGSKSKSCRKNGVKELLKTTGSTRINHVVKIG